MKALAAVLLLAVLTGCSATAKVTAAKPPPRMASAKALPYAPPPPDISAQEGVLCAADVRLCRGGGSVSRNAAKACAFDPCPGEAQH